MLVERVPAGKASTAATAAGIAAASSRLSKAACANCASYMAVVGWADTASGRWARVWRQRTLCAEGASATRGAVFGAKHGSRRVGAAGLRRRRDLDPRWLPQRHRRAAERSRRGARRVRQPARRRNVRFLLAERRYRVCVGGAHLHALDAAGDAVAMADEGSPLPGAGAAWSDHERESDASSDRLCLLPRHVHRVRRRVLREETDRRGVAVGVVLRSEKGERGGGGRRQVRVVHAVRAQVAVHALH
mmetsp:Transcript_4076/g.8783  ORF Transcript_4076/g.8783 Transcript_4076/m.8783 type:complete len:246 (-) Transcript_4076:1045-1782(-)